jgi:putative effector of murein hydrolase LrgA (UPF0299 family)
MVMMVMMTARTSGYSYSSCRTNASSNSMRLTKRVIFSAASPSARTSMMYMSSSSQQPRRYTCNPKVSSSSSALKMSSASDTDKTTNNKMIKAVFSTVSLVLLDVLARALCKRLQITFPSSLAACGALLLGLLILPGGETLYSKLAPGSAVLAKWLPVFFVPSLVTVSKMKVMRMGNQLFVPTVYSNCTSLNLLVTCTRYVAKRCVLTFFSFVRFCRLSLFVSTNECSFPLPHLWDPPLMYVFYSYLGYIFVNSRRTLNFLYL